MVSRVFATALLSLGLAAGCEHAVGQSAASDSLQATDAEMCEISRAPEQFDGKLLRLHAYVSRGFEDSTLHDPACPEEALVNMGDPGGWLTEIWAEFADHTDYWGVKGFAPLVTDEQLAQFRTLLLERRRVHQMTAATMIGTFYAGKAAGGKDYKAPRFRGYGHMGCCSLFVISRIESVDTHYSSDLNYSSGDWSVDMPQGCYSEQMLSLPRNGTIRSWQKDADEGRDVWHYDPRQTAEDHLEKLRSAALGSGRGGKTELLVPKKSKLKPPVDQPSVGKLTEQASTPSLKRYEWLEPDRVTRFVVVISRPYWLADSAASADKVIWAPVGASVLQCAAAKR
jgi:hypothetical protein